MKVKREENINMKKIMTVDEKKEYLLSKKGYTFEDLVILVEVLRSEKGCPWDREQTHKSIRKDFIEETYEVIESIDTEDPVLMREELGDVLLQIVFHACIGKEDNEFDIADVTNDICVKLIHRHPHVFGDVLADTSEKVLSNWEKIKSDEKERRTVTDKLRAIPPMLPALMRAEKVGKKAKCFDFADADSVISKVHEETSEFEEAYAENNIEAMSEEMGDLLLTLTSLCRKTGIDPEIALNNATNKFIDRFELVENSILERKMDIENVSMSELDAIWDEIKHK